MHLEPVVTLGDRDGPGMLDSAYNRVRARPDGSFYVFSPDRPYFWVFDARGEIVRRVGRSGQGPGEFGGISAMAQADDGSLYVFDHRQLRMSVFSSTTHEPIRTVNVGFTVNTHAIEVETGIVVNAGIRSSPERAPYPLHLVDLDGNLVRSFGSEVPVYRPELRDIIHGRAVVPAGGDAVWSGWWNQYVIERWDTEGNLTKVVRREVEWFEPWWDLTTDIDRPPDPVTQAVMQQDDTLWVVVAVPDPNWRSTVRPSGRFFTVDDQNVYQDSIIEAIDLRTGEVRASTRFPQRFVGFAGPGLVYGLDHDPDGDITIPVWEIGIVQPTGVTHPR